MSDLITVNDLRSIKFIGLAADAYEGCERAADALEAKDAEIERLKGDLQVTRLQRDARMVSEFVVDDAVKAEIERLQTEASCNYSCNYCGKYHGKEVCESLLAEIERLQREWDEDLKSMTLQWEVWEEADKAKDAEIERLRAALDWVEAELETEDE